MKNRNTFGDKPLSKDELKSLIEADKIFAFGEIEPGRFVIRNADRRREYEVRILAMEYYLKNVKWMTP
jgi:hypothetical protein